FLERLPMAIRHQLIALEMEDHYVRAHAPGTSILVLLRMRDAVAELADIDGERVHRSWWVRRDAVERVAGGGRNLRLILTGGIEAPVARERVATLRAAGWMDR
ncbi:MAG: LytTR family transcriptional regulator DNA-binding domain-containing protein, partial [Sphingomonas sp.]|nr:LytTR family transcriptional regulator DNA-binding domain-containing protein [Sphingomonas sp.]